MSIGHRLRCISASWLRGAFLDEVRAAGLSEASTVYEVDPLVIRRKGQVIGLLSHCLAVASLSSDLTVSLLLASLSLASESQPHCSQFLTILLLSLSHYLTLSTFTPYHLYLLL